MRLIRLIVHLTVVFVISNCAAVFADENATSMKIANQASALTSMVAKAPFSLSISDITLNKRAGFQLSLRRD